MGEDGKRRERTEGYERWEVMEWRLRGREGRGGYRQRGVRAGDGGSERGVG